jgi:hypothetical protein
VASAVNVRAELLRQIGERNSSGLGKACNPIAQVLRNHRSKPYMFAREELVPGITHPILSVARPHRLRVVNQRYGRLLGGVNPRLALSLHPFCSTAPLRYINNAGAESLLSFLEVDPGTTLEALAKDDLQISHAVRSLLRPGASWGRENDMAVDKPDKLLEFEQVWHPEYQRYCEHVFNHLINVPLRVLGGRKGKDYHSPKLAVRVDLLTKNGLAYLTEGFDSTLRNAIAHGTTLYTDHSVIYVNSHTRKEVWASNFSQYFDPLVANCHAIVVAILLFICRNEPQVRQHGLERLPFGLRYLLMKGVASHDGFAVRDAVESEITGSPQVSIYAESTTRSRAIHMLESLSAAVAIQEFGGTGYERILVFTDPGRGAPALAGLNASALANLRREGWSESRLSAVFESSFLWHDTNRAALRLWTWRNLLKHIWREYRAEVSSNWRTSGLPVWGSRYRIRQIRKQGLGFTRMLWVEISLVENEEPSKATVRGVLQHAYRRLRKRPTSGDPEGKLSWIPWFPCRIWFRVHAANGPIRSSQGGWANPEMLGQGEWIAWPQRLYQKPTWVKLPDELRRGLLIRFNPNHPVPD